MRVMVTGVMMVVVMMAGKCRHGHQNHCDKKQRQQLFHGRDYSAGSLAINLH
jgi:hypothetical protein